MGGGLRHGCPRPIFRIFSPVLQARSSTRTAPMCGTLGAGTCALPCPPFLHRPWEAATSTRRGYPPPIVDRAAARARALAAFAAIRTAGRMIWPPQGFAGIRAVGDVHGEAGEPSAPPSRARGRRNLFVLQLGDLTDDGPDSGRKRCG